MERDELTAWLRLTTTPGVGRTSARRLLAAYGLPQEVFAHTPADWRQHLAPGPAQALAQLPPRLDEQIGRTWQWLHAGAEAPEAAGLRRAIVTLGDAAYPPALLETPDPPLLLYLLGAAELLDAGQPFAPTACLAVVGSRNPTPQGRENARQFARALAGQGLCIVSGLALGVDAAAHEGALALAEGGPAGAADAPGMSSTPGAPRTARTIAVVGTGLDRVYPAAHRSLAQRIARHGVLVSEYPLGAPPLPAHFPQRNRIISGLALGTLVVEAAPASGSLITARMAAEQGREVFAIPGSVHAPQARGCHALIRDGAMLVETAQDVLDELRPVLARQQADGGSGAGSAADRGSEGSDKGSDESSDEVLQALGHDPAGLDALIARTGLDAARLQVRLLELELDGQVARLPGGLFQRMARA